MKIKNQVILVTGANRGIGKALVQAALQRGASKVYAAARKPSELPDFGDARVVPLTLDVTLPEQVAAASQIASDVSLLINNAGALAFASVIDGDFNALESDMRVNYFGTLRVTRAFAPVLIASGGGVASISSIVGLASMAAVGGYSASKAALFSAIQAMRAEFKKKKEERCGLWYLSWSY
jgi:NAD(P)-dependent dehydrogenase (short-subunit alcohol dehydrogenase family)